MANNATTTYVSYWDQHVSNAKLSSINTRIPEYIDDFNITLFDHQRIAVCAMLDLEKRRKRIVMYKEPVKEVYTSSGILAEPFGAGKTVECLALIKMCQQPDFKPISIFTVGKRYNDVNGCYKLVTGGKLVKPNLIIVGASVFNQWLDCIKKITNFSVLTVFNNKTVREFNTIINTNGAIDKYDIVLVKNGDCSTNMIDNAAIANLNVATFAIPSCIGIMTPGFIWSRVIIDDYDTIGLKDERGASIGRFTWYISATQKKIQKRCAELSKNKYSVIDKSYLHRITNDENLNEYFKIANDINYINECVKIYKPRFWVHYIRRKMENVINFIANDGDLSDVCREMINSDAIGTLAELLGLKTNNVMVIFEKILSDKFGKYKETIIYHQNIKNAIEYCKTEEYAKQSHDDALSHDNPLSHTNPLPHTATISQRRPLPNFINKASSSANSRHGHDTNDNHPRENVKHDMKKYIKEGKINEIPYIVDAVGYLTNLSIKVAQDIKDQDKALQRLRDNFRNDECSVCLLDFENNVFILKCCGYSICESCVYKGTQMHHSATKIDGSCPNCKTKIKFTDLIALDPNIDIKQLTDEETFKNQLMSESIAPMPSSGDQTATNEKPGGDNDLIVPYDKLHPKVKVIYDIVSDKIPPRVDLSLGNDKIPPRVDLSPGNDKIPARNIAPPLVKLCDINDTYNRDINKKDDMLTYQLDRDLTSLISSDIELDRPLVEKKKVIVFANYGETLSIVRDQLPVSMTMILQGTARQMSVQLQEFKNNDTSVLLINSQKHCAGINIQFASDLVFFHKIINPALEAQVEGRIQRPGRKFSANIHYLLYNTESL